MSRLPALPARTVIRYLEASGFREVRVRSSHHIMTHPDGRTVPVPMHNGKDLGPGLIRKIIKEAGLTRDAFLEWLQG